MMPRKRHQRSKNTRASQESSWSERHERSCAPSSKGQKAHRSRRLQSIKQSKRYQALVSDRYAVRPDAEMLWASLVPLKALSEPQIDLGVHPSYVLPSLRLHRPSLTVRHLQAPPSIRSEEHDGSSGSSSHDTSAARREGGEGSERSLSPSSDQDMHKTPSMQAPLVADFAPPAACLDWSITFASREHCQEKTLAGKASTARSASSVEPMEVSDDADFTISMVKLASCQMVAPSRNKSRFANMRFVIDLDDDSDVDFDTVVEDTSTFCALSSPTSSAFSTSCSSL